MESDGTEKQLPPVCLTIMQTNGGLFDIQGSREEIDILRLLDDGDADVVRPEEGQTAQIRIGVGAERAGFDAVFVQTGADLVKVAGRDRQILLRQFIVAVGAADFYLR